MADDRASFENQADGLFVNSEISDKDTPIGGCYQIFDDTTNGYSSYVLEGGDLDVGKAWLYVSEVRDLCLTMCLSFISVSKLVLLTYIYDRSLPNQLFT